ncbi:hypothetical protein [Emticicia sp. 17c]|uniref:hypothetical protein n=1 Tax=Emticicia sp. 17c TaxID=3127704 RepID=UPI00301D9C6B
MKKNMIVFFLCLLISNSLFCQTLAIKDLIKKMTCEKFECFNDFVINKGFSFSKSERFSLSKKNSGIYYSYISDSNFTATKNKGVTTRNTVTIYFLDDGTTRISFSTSVSKYYQTFLNEIKSLNYLSTGSAPMTDGVIVTYSSKTIKDYDITVTTSVGKLQDMKYNIYILMIDKI